MLVYHKLGDAIEGERIVCQYRKMSKETLIQGSGAHRSRKTNLDEAYCVITKPLRLKLKKE